MIVSPTAMVKFVWLATALCVFHFPTASRAQENMTMAMNMTSDDNTTTTMVMNMTADDNMMMPTAMTTEDNTTSGSMMTMDLAFGTIGDGFCSARHLTFVENYQDLGKPLLLVAEAGIGPIPIPEDPKTSPDCIYSEDFDAWQCYGTTSGVRALVLNSDGDSTGDELDILKGVMSLRTTEGQGEEHAIGAHAAVMTPDGDIWTIVGQGGVNGTQLTARGVLSGVVLDTNNQVVTSPYEIEYEYDPDGEGPESDPYHILYNDEYSVYYVVDAGANTILTYKDLPGGVPDDILVTPGASAEAFPAGVGPCVNVTPPMGPPFCGVVQDNTTGTWYYPVQAVPTAVRMRPGVSDQLYYSTLTGAVWNDAKAAIYQVPLIDGIPDADTSKIEPIAGDFYAVVDFAFYNQNELYVLEANPGVPFMPFNGRLTHVKLDTQEYTVVQPLSDQLVAPNGMIIHGDVLYLSNNTYNYGVDPGLSCVSNIVGVMLKSADMAGTNATEELVPTNVTGTNATEEVGPGSVLVNGTEPTEAVGEATETTTEATGTETAGTVAVEEVMPTEATSEDGSGVVQEVADSADPSTP